MDIKVRYLDENCFPLYNLKLAFSAWQLLYCAILKAFDYRYLQLEAFRPYANGKDIDLSMLSG